MNTYKFKYLSFAIVIIVISQCFIIPQHQTKQYKKNNIYLTEIPNLEIPNYKFNCTILKRKYYTLCYNNNLYQPNWVAYKLEYRMLNNIYSRKNIKFQKDPSPNINSALPSDYTKSGYDRGHLCPAGDMKFNLEALKETFYMPNISPQVPQFNRGIWKDLEEKIREWVNNDSSICYIVTGPIFNNDINKKIKNIYVPKYFYKVILKYSVKNNEINGIGFIFENKTYKSNLVNYAITIDSVEKFTSIDFFYLLPDSIENKCEKTLNINKWFKK